MNKLEIKESFHKLKGDFALVSSQVISVVQESLKIVVNERPSPLGGFEWTFEKSGCKATLRLFSNGIVNLYFQTQLTIVEKDQLDTSSDYSKVEYKFPDEAYYLTADSELEKLIQRMKKFFSI